MLVDLVGISVLLEKTTEDAHAADPQDLSGHTGVLGTSSLTETGVSTKALGLESLAGSIARVDNWRLTDDETVLDEFADVLACLRENMLITKKREPGPSKFKTYESWPWRFR